MHRRAFLATVALAAGGCTIGGDPHRSDDLTLSSPASADGEIPVRYTCDGEGVSPPLHVAGVPDRADSLAVVGEWLYSYTPGTIWLLWNLPAEGSLDVPEDVPDRPRLEDPDGAFQGTNDEGFVGYRPPCHETPQYDEYRFSLLALESPPDLDPGSTREAFDDAVEGLVVSSTSVTASYDRV